MKKRPEDWRLDKSNRLNTRGDGKMENTEKKVRGRKSGVVQREGNAV